MNENQMNSGREYSDDLTTIKGIGPARQQWFKDSLNVHTPRDLAVLSIDGIYSRLIADGFFISRNEIKKWIAQASDLMSIEPLKQVNEVANSQDVLKLNSPAEKSDWKPFASFVVEFQVRNIEGQTEEKQTIIHHLEADKNKKWPGMENMQLCQWMQDQIVEISSFKVEPSGDSDIKAKLVKPIPITMEIAQVQAYQPSDTEKPIAIGVVGQAFKGSVQGDEPFALVALLELSRAGTEEMVSEQRQYQARFYISRLPTGPEIHLGDSEPRILHKGQSPYTAILRKVTLSSGFYSLRVIATLQGTSQLGYAQVPFLQVV